MDCIPSFKEWSQRNPSSSITFNHVFGCRDKKRNQNSYQSISNKQILGKRNKKELSNSRTSQLRFVTRLQLFPYCLHEYPQWGHLSTHYLIPWQRRTVCENDGWSRRSRCHQLFSSGPSPWCDSHPFTPAVFPASVSPLHPVECYQW